MNEKALKKNASEITGHKSKSKTPTEVRAEITKLYQKTNSGQELAAALKARYYKLVRSTRHVIFVIDKKGGEHNLISRIAAPRDEIETKLADLDPAALPLKKTREREAFIKCFLTLAEKTEIKARADQAELTVSGYLRSLIFGKNTPQPKASRRPLAEKEELVNIRYELRKIGGNLNQIAHSQNQGKGFDNIAFAKLNAEHLKALKAIMTALGKE